MYSRDENVNLAQIMQTIDYDERFCNFSGIDILEAMETLPSAVPTLRSWMRRVISVLNVIYWYREWNVRGHYDHFLSSNGRFIDLYAKCGGDLAIPTTVGRSMTLAEVYRERQSCCRRVFRRNGVRNRTDPQTTIARLSRSDFISSSREMSRTR